MDIKEKFLKTLKDQAQVYLDAYESMKGLPLSVFEALNHHKEIVSMEGTKEATDALEAASTYGGNTNLLRTMLKSAGERGLTKSEIVAKFPKTADVYAAATNAITWLKQKGEVEHYKPKGVTMKGYFWRLRDR